MKSPACELLLRAGGLGWEFASSSLPTHARWPVGFPASPAVAMEKESDGFNTAVWMSPQRRATTSWTGSSK